MRFAFLLSTHGGSPLQVGLERGLRALGHVVDYFYDGRIHNFDILVIFNQTAHRIDYAYPVFPEYNVPVVFIDTGEYGYFKRLPSVVHGYCNAFASGSMNHDTKSLHEQTRLRRFLDGKSFPYFLREFSKHVDYPLGYYPIDYPLYELSRCDTRPDHGDYLRRTDPVFVSWGASHPWRWAITHALRAASPKAEILVLEENGTPRMLQSTYFNRMVRARCAPSFDGYGSSSFRMTEILVRTVLLLGPLSIRMRDPLIDGETCVAYNLETSGEDCLGTDIADKLKEILDDPERSFRIYEAGYDHCMTHLTEQATAAYLLSTIEAHDWQRTTQLDIISDEQRKLDWQPLPDFS